MKYQNVVKGNWRSSMEGRITYNYDKSKPVTDRLKKKHNKVKQINPLLITKNTKIVAGNMRTAVPSAISVAPHPALHVIRTKLSKLSPPKQKIVMLSLVVTLKISYDSPGGVTHGTSRCLTTKAPRSNEIASQRLKTVWNPTYNDALLPSRKQ